MINCNFLASIGFRTRTLGYGGFGTVFKRYLGTTNPINKGDATQWMNIERKRAVTGIILNRNTISICSYLFIASSCRFFSSKSASKDAKINKKLDALPAPPKRGESPWIVFIKEKFKQTIGTPKEILKQSSSIWKNMSQEERQTYKDISEEKKLQALRTYSNWVNSLSPQEIIKENNIRSQLRRQGKKGVTFIKDPRKPKRPLSSFLFFCAYARSCPDFIEKYAQGRTKITEQTKILAEKWATMGDSERQEFVNCSANDKERYQREMEIYYKL
ncbi:hypothetical protein T552_02500 [Pneumocystis carinii B80]|uniref:HMG box domain-containing protein n=1 Tax=Pneumocystis carinii (strain B80) TaxID=1408658 RepID=A0A0W4ZF57_PNEC8|nr:hypothetical protein T552_02500 [Pneumocystis carinii B80]KTW27008.1 hypothetical protein T552_02500 [Pneumocystis carinii B80]